MGSSWQLSPGAAENLRGMDDNVQAVLTAMLVSRGITSVVIVANNYACGNELAEHLGLADEFFGAAREFWKRCE